MDNPRCDVVIVRGQKQAVFPPKLQVGQQLAKLCGWDAPTKVEVETGTELAAFLGGLFAGGGTLSNSGSNGERSKEASGSAAAVGISEERALEAFRDSCWRLNNLYSIRTRDGTITKFRPRPQSRHHGSVRRKRFRCALTQMPKPTSRRRRRPPSQLSNRQTWTRPSPHPG
jgi:hypothetical protein